MLEYDKIQQCYYSRIVFNRKEENFFIASRDTNVRSEI